MGISRMGLNAIFKQIELFNGLSEEEINAIAGICHEYTFQRGEEIAVQGDIGNEIYIITQGIVEILVNDKMDPEIKRTVANLGKGQIIGEMGLVDHGPRSATVKAIEDITCVQAINFDDLKNLFLNNTHIGYIVMSNLAADLSFKLRHINISMG